MTYVQRAEAAMIDAKYHTEHREQSDEALVLGHAAVWALLEIGAAVRELTRAIERRP